MTVEADLLLKSYLKRLKLPTVATNYRRFAQEASQSNQPYERYLLALAEAEVHHREANSERKRIAQARFPVLKGLDSFDFAAIPSLNKQAVLELTQGNYIQGKENVVFAGPTGTGKTHCAIALGVAACRQEKRVRFATAAGLINELTEAQAQLRLSKLERALSSGWTCSSSTRSGSSPSPRRALSCSSASSPSATSGGRCWSPPTWTSPVGRRSSATPA